MEMETPGIPFKFSDLIQLVEDFKPADVFSLNFLMAENLLNQYIAFEFCLRENIRNEDEYRQFIYELKKTDTYEYMRRKANGETEEIECKRIDLLLDKDKKKYKEPEFFRPYGPMWIDFEKKYIVLRDEEIERIHKTFEKSNIALVNGSPASGKSVFLKSLGYKLINEAGADVYYFDLNETLSLVDVIKNITKLKDGYIIIDNVHRNREYADNFIKQISFTNLKVLLSTRDDQSNYFITYYHYLKVQLNENSISIKSVDIAEKIIDRYLEIYSNLIIKKSERNKLATDNLMVLVWKLNSLRNYGQTHRDLIAYEAESHLEKLRLIDLKDRYDASQIRTVFLILSAFFVYEIPVNNNFLTQHFQITQGLIDFLVGLNEINAFTNDKKVRALSLHHSELAEIYLYAFKKSAHLTSELNFAIDDEWIGQLFCNYVKACPEELINIYRNTALIVYFRNPSYRKTEHFDIADIRKLHSTLISKNEDLIITHINNEPYLRNITYIILDLFWNYKLNSNSMAIALFFKKLNFTEIIKRTYDESNVHYNTFFLVSLLEIFQETNIEIINPKQILKSIDMKKFAQINNNKPNELINLAYYFKRIDLNIYNEFINNINIDILSDSFKNELDLRTFNVLAGIISETNHKNTSILFDKVGEELIIKAINCANNNMMQDIAETIDLSISLDKRKAINILKGIDVEHMSNSINECDNIDDIHSLFSALVRVKKSKKMDELIARIDFKEVCKKIINYEELCRFAKIIDRWGRDGSCMYAYNLIMSEIMLRVAGCIIPNLDKLEMEGKIKVKRKGKRISIEL